MIDRSIVGDLINFRGLVYAPTNENGVIFLFGKIADDLNMYIEEIKPGFPDCIGRRFIGRGWERVTIEFEYQSYNFKQHGHDAEQCDIIICWEHNWPECPIEVIELKSEIQGLENYPILRPISSSGSYEDPEKAFSKLLENVNPNKNVIDWYDKILNGISKENDSIWAKVGAKYIGWYSPEKSFVSLLIKKQVLRFECFCRGEVIQGTKISNTRFSPRWCKFAVKSDDDVDKAINILKISLKRIQDALKSGETTGYYSGGEPFGTVKEIMEGDEEAEDTK